MEWDTKQYVLIKFESSDGKMKKKEIIFQVNGKY
jgi:hypothetical protein